MPSSELLAKYADVAIRVGIGLEPGARLLISSPLSAAEFARTLVEQAYEAGAANVDVLWSDEAVSRSRFTKGSIEASEVVTSMAHAQLAAYEAGDVFLYVTANDPNAMAGIDPSRIATFQKANGEALKPLNRARETFNELGVWSLPRAMPGRKASFLRQLQPTQWNNCGQPSSAPAELIKKIRLLHGRSMPPT